MRHSLTDIRCSNGNNPHPLNFMPTKNTTKPQIATLPGTDIPMLCVDGKAHTFKKLPPDGKDYNNGDYYLNTTEKAFANGEKYRERTREFGKRKMFCPKCTRQLDMSS